MKIALCQTRSGITAADNARMLDGMIATAAAEGAVMAFTPEMSGLMDRNATRASSQLTSEANDVVLAAMQTAARRHGIWIALGSLAIAGATTDGRLVNRSFVIDDLGTIRARYDKIHLFDVDLASGESWRESARYSPGEGGVLLTTPIGRLGLSICYDLRFPALYEALSNHGAEILSVPAAFTVPTGEAHWHVMLRARAIEAGCFVVAAAQSGVHEDGRTTFGHSLVVDPWGRILLDMGTQTGVACVELDLAAVASARGQIPALDHRRTITHITASP